MSGRLPVDNARQVIRALEKAGFAVVRTTGSHRIMDHRDVRLEQSSCHFTQGGI